MRRRDLLRGIIGSTVAWPLAAYAQQPATPVVGFLSSRGPEDSRDLLTAFREGMRAGGYTEGQNVFIEYRWARGQYDRLPKLAAELVSSRVSMFVAFGEPSVFAAKSATSSIPIVFTTGGDPVKTGLVESLNHPGGNMTGVSLLITAPDAKRLGLLHELLPATAVIGVLIDPNYQQAEDQAREVMEAGRKIGIQIEIAHAGNDQDLETAFSSLVARKVAALLVTADPYFETRRDRIIGLAAKFGLPAIYQFRDYAMAGGLMSYGISLADGYRQVGTYASQILRGAQPANLPVYQSVKFEFVLNLRTARTLSIQVPPTLSARADEVIE